MFKIILVNYNGSEDTINCINSISKSIGKNTVKICIYDNNSNNEQKALLKNYAEGFSDKNISIEIFWSDVNGGFAKGNNYFIKNSVSGDFLWILNNDTLVNEELLSKIFANLPQENEALYFECRTFENIYHDSGFHYTNMISGKSKFNKTSPFDFGYICAQSMVLKYSENLPLFDEDYFLYYEDCDYGFRLKNAGFKYKKLENCYFNHKIGGSCKNEKKKINYVTLRSQVKFMKKYSKCFWLYKIIKNCILLFLKKDTEGVKRLKKYCLEVKADSVFTSVLD